MASQASLFARLIERPPLVGRRSGRLPGSAHSPAQARRHDPPFASGQPLAHLLASPDRHERYEGRGADVQPPPPTPETTPRRPGILPPPRRRLRRLDRQSLARRSSNPVREVASDQGLVLQDAPVSLQPFAGGEPQDKVLEVAPDQLDNVARARGSHAGRLYSTRADLGVFSSINSCGTLLK